MSMTLNGTKTQSSPTNTLIFDPEVEQGQGQSQVVTTATFIVPYYQNTTSGHYYPNTTGLDTLYFVLGYTNGAADLCYFSPPSLDITCDTLVAFNGCGNSNGEDNSLFAGEISDVTYVPQNNAIVALGFNGEMYVFDASWNGTIPVLDVPKYLPTEYTYSIFGPCTCIGCQYDTSILIEIYGTNSMTLSRNLAVVYVNPELTYVYVAGLFYITECVLPYQMLTPDQIKHGGVTIFQLTSKNELEYVGEVEGTEACTQILPSTDGLYATCSAGQNVLYIPYEEPDTKSGSGNSNNTLPIGLIGSSPTLHIAYEIQNDSDFVTSIGFSSNAMQSVVYRNPLTGQIGNVYPSGAIIVSTTTINDNIDGCSTSKTLYEEACQDTNKVTISPLASNSCAGSITLVDICTGQPSLFVDNIVDGPVYSTITDINMNFLTQNGEGGLSYWSVGFVPGRVQDAVALVNEASPACNDGGDLFDDILAGVTMVLAIVALPELLPEAITTFAAYSSLVVAGVGVAALFEPNW